MSDIEDGQRLVALAEYERVRRRERELERQVDHLNKVVSGLRTGLERLRLRHDAGTCEYCSEGDEDDCFDRKQNEHIDSALEAKP